jgi:glycosyltransferase involved in cell wall biosynthesis
MRLLLIANDFPNPYEPTKGVFNYYLARSLARDHQLDVISPLAWVDEFRARRHMPRSLNRSRSIRVDGFTVHHPRYIYPPKVLRSHYGAFYWRSILPTVRKLLKESPPEAVIGYWAHPDGAAAVRVARHVGVPAGVVVGGSDVLLLTGDRGRRRRIESVLRAADSVVALSSDLREKVMGLGVPGERVHLWQQGIDSDVFTPGDRNDSRRRLGIPIEGRALLWVGRLVPVKGLDILLKSCEILRDRGVSFHLYLVGEGPLRGTLEADAAVRGLSSCITFVGSQPHSRLADWYRAADLTVLSSRSEGLPNVLRESLACGTPFVSSRVGGVADIAGDGAGRLVPPGDPVAMAREIAVALAEWGPDYHPRSSSISWSASSDTLMRLVLSHSSGVGVSTPPSTYSGPDLPSIGLLSAMEAIATHERD